MIKCIEANYDAYGLDGLDFDLKPPSVFTQDTQQNIISLPVELYFGNYSQFYEKQSSGYSYHCNEPSYNKYHIKYRYGWCHLQDCMKEPAVSFVSIKNLQTEQEKLQKTREAEKKIQLRDEKIRLRNEKYQLKIRMIEENKLREKNRLTNLRLAEEERIREEDKIFKVFHTNDKINDAK